MVSSKSCAATVAEPPERCCKRVLGRGGSQRQALYDTGMFVTGRIIAYSMLGAIAGGAIGKGRVVQHRGGVEQRCQPGHGQAIGLAECGEGQQCVGQSAAHGDVVDELAFRHAQRPSKPRVLLNIVVALFVGTLLGVGLALGLELRDRRVRSSEDLADALEVPLLGQLVSAGNVLKSKPAGALA